MHRQKFPQIIVLTLFILSLNAFAVSTPTLKDRIGKALSDLKVSLAKERDFKTKAKALSEFETNFKKWRDESERQDTEEEIYFDQLGAALKYIPRTKVLSSADCEKTNTEILFALEPTASTKQPKQPAVKDAVDVLKVFGDCPIAWTK